MKDPDRCTKMHIFDLFWVSLFLNSLNRFLIEHLLLSSRRDSTWPRTVFLKPQYASFDPTGLKVFLILCISTALMGKITTAGTEATFWGVRV